MGQVSSGGCTSSGNDHSNIHNISINNSSGGHNMSNTTNNNGMHIGDKRNTDSNGDVCISNGGSSNGGNCVGNN